MERALSHRVDDAAARQHLRRRRRGARSRDAALRPPVGSGGLDEELPPAPLLLRRAMVRLDPQSSMVLVVDVQERLAAAMPEVAVDRLVGNVRVLLESARLLGVPVVATEQYPKGLGPTVPDPGVEAIAKTPSDACDQPRPA